MSFNCEIENKLHQARLQMLNNHFEDAMKIFIESLDSLEKHKTECEGEELEWTLSCFNRTLEEFNLIRDAHPEIQIRVQESDDEPENIATEDVPQTENQETTFMEDVERVSSDAINLLKQFDENYHISESIAHAFATGKKNVQEFFAEKSLGEHIKDGYHETVNYCKENRVVEKGVYAVKAAACLIIQGVVVVTKAVAKGVRTLIGNYSEKKENTVAEAAEQYSQFENPVAEQESERSPETTTEDPVEMKDDQPKTSESM